LAGCFAPGDGAQYCLDGRHLPPMVTRTRSAVWSRWRSSLASTSTALTMQPSSSGRSRPSSCH